MSVQGYWSDLKAPDFAALPEDMIAVLPLGATEQHGPHLPVSVDSDLASEAAARTLAELGPAQNVLILPRLSITKSNEHSAHAGTLSLSGATLLAVLSDIAASVARAGVKRLVFFNAHGGNAAVLEIAGRDARIAHGLIVASCTWSGFADWPEHISAQDYASDIHAGMVETSAMLASRPELVDMSCARDFHSKVRFWAEGSGAIGLTGQPARPAWTIDDLSESGACGNAAVATAEAGEALLSSSARGFAAFLAEFAGFDPKATP